MAVLDINGEAAEKVAIDLQSDGARALGVQVDVANPAAIVEAFDTVRDWLGPTISW